jgi:hypothetical protein
MGADYRDYVEIVFQKDEDERCGRGTLTATPSGPLCLNGRIFVCNMDGGKWSPASRQGYNLRDGLSRGTLFRCDIIVLPSEILSLLTLKALKVLCCYSSSTSASGSRNPPSVNPKERAPLWSRRRTRLL